MTQTMTAVGGAARNVDELATPCMVVDAAVAERNIRRLADYAAKHGIGIRPHTKTHKSKRLAKMLMATPSH